MTLVDSNVVLDIVTHDPQWFDWSLGAIEAAALRGRVGINEVVYAEVSVRYPTIKALDKMLQDVGCDLVRTPETALFMAGKAFRQYRSAGGMRTGVLADFFIGAHAAALGAPLLSRDARRYRTYFPAVELITPFAS